MRSPSSTSNSVTAVASTFSTANVTAPDGYSVPVAAHPDEVSWMTIVVASDGAD
jgi:hypothetical protein